MIAQLLQKIKLMQVIQPQINGLTLTNQGPINQVRQGSEKQKRQKKLNPKIGLPWKCYCWMCGCCPHWVKSRSQKKRGIKDDAQFKNRICSSDENYL